jgi:hypothetical protein
VGVRRAVTRHGSKASGYVGLADSTRSDASGFFAVRSGHRDDLRGWRGGEGTRSPPVRRRSRGPGQRPFVRPAGGVPLGGLALPAGLHPRRLDLEGHRVDLGGGFPAFPELVLDGLGEVARLRQPTIGEARPQALAGQRQQVGGNLLSDGARVHRQHRRRGQGEAPPFGDRRQEHHDLRRVGPALHGLNFGQRVREPVGDG